MKIIMKLSIILLSIILSLCLFITSSFAESSVLQVTVKYWAFKTGGYIYSTPAIGSDGTIYTGSTDSNLYAINPDGTKKWTFKTGGIASYPIIGSDGTIYIGSSDNNLYSLNPDGTKKWFFKTSGILNLPPCIGSDGTIYLGSNSTELFAINPNGTMKWIFKTGGTIYSSPVIGSDGTIYIGSSDSNLYAVNPDGTKKWVLKIGGVIGTRCIVATPAIGSDGTIYVGANDTRLYAINPDGTKKWSFRTSGLINLYPAIGKDGTIYAGTTDKNLYAINPDGTQKWVFETGGAIYSSPVIGSDETIYVGSTDKNLYAVNPDGTRKWAFRTGNAVNDPPAIDSKGIIYIGSNDTNLYAINSHMTSSEINSLVIKSSHKFPNEFTGFHEYLGLLGASDSVGGWFKGTGYYTDGTYEYILPKIEPGFGFGIRYGGESPTYSSWCSWIHSLAVEFTLSDSLHNGVWNYHNYDANLVTFDGNFKFLLTDIKNPFKIYGICGLNLSFITVKNGATDGSQSYDAFYSLSTNFFDIISRYNLGMEIGYALSNNVVLSAGYIYRAGSFGEVSPKSSWVENLVPTLNSKNSSVSIGINYYF